MVDTEEPNNGGFVRVSLAPNPATDAARLSVNVPASMEAQVSIVNMLGQTVQRRNVRLTEGDNTIGLDMQQLAPGTYVVRLLAGNSGVALKVVKQ
ncbi:MAG: T9SS type A sorting domain-containing protein [Lewinellaceae bacterium]|nr:T9SS type A sorting domain-containing protein [Lewinellaceae bacterium]